MEIGDDFHQIVECFETFVKEIKLKVGSDYKVGTLKNYNVTIVHLKDFITSQYFLRDIPLKDLNYKFIIDFELMCKTKWDWCEKQHHYKTHSMDLQSSRYSNANEWLEKDPFHLYSGKQQKGTIKFISGEELKAIEKSFFLERVERVRDMFIFPCYMG